MLFGPTAAIRVMFFLTASLFNFLKTNEKGNCILLIYFQENLLLYVCITISYLKNLFLVTRQLQPTNKPCTNIKISTFESGGNLRKNM